MEKIARCEQSTGKHASLIRDLQVCDHRNGQKIASLTITTAINCSNDQETLLRAVLDFKNGKMTTAASILPFCSDGTTNETPNRDSPTETASIGIQADIPFPSLYGSRDSTVYERDKFRSESIDKYGGMLSTTEKETNDRSNGTKSGDENQEPSRKNINFEEVSSGESIIEEEPPMTRYSNIEKIVVDMVMHTGERKAAKMAKAKNRKICQYEEEETRNRKMTARLLARKRSKTSVGEQSENSKSRVSLNPELTGRMRPTVSIEEIRRQHPDGDEQSAKKS